MIKLKSLIGEEKQPLNEKLPGHEIDHGLDYIADSAEKLGRNLRSFAHSVSRDLDSRENRLVGKALKDYNTFFNSFKTMYKKIS